MGMVTVSVMVTARTLTDIGAGTMTAMVVIGVTEDITGGITAVMAEMDGDQGKP